MGLEPAAWGVDEEVEQHLLAGRGARQEEPAAAEAGEGRLGDGGREPRRHARVEGVATRGEHLDGGGGGGRVAGGHRDRDRRAHRQICWPSSRRPARSVMSRSK